MKGDPSTGLWVAGIFIARIVLCMFIFYLLFFNFQIIYFCFGFRLQHFLKIIFFYYRAHYSQHITDHKKVVSCPSPGCNNEILFCNVKNILDVNMVIKFQRLSLKFAANQNNASIW